MKTRLYILLAATVLFGFSSCTSKSERAKRVSEAFWRVIDTGQTDSVNILYPNFANLGIRASQIKLIKYETKDVIDRGDKSFEVRTIVYPRGANDPEICSLFIRKEKGNWTIYDSRYLSVHRFEDLKLLKTFNDIADGDIYMEMTDQERCFAIDSVIYKIKQQIIEPIKTEVSQKVNVTPYNGYLCRNTVFSNNTSYDLSGVEISYTFKYHTSCSSYNADFSYTIKSFKAGCSQITLYESGWGHPDIVKITNLKVSISDDEAWKVYKPTGTEYKEYMQSIGK